MLSHPAVKSSDEFKMFTVRQTAFAPSTEVEGGNSFH
jgi:hypothetical protein